MERGAVIDPDLAACGRRNVAHTYVELSRTVPGAKVERSYGFIAVTAPVNLSFCNFALDFDLRDRDPDRVMAALRRTMDGKEVFRAFHIPISNDDPTEEALQRAGWRRQHSLIQMAWRPDSVRPPIELTLCTHPAERLEIAVFMVEQFFWRQSSAMRQAILDATISSCHEIYRVGSGNSIEAAVMAARLPDSLGLYNLCVRRNLRGRGIGGQVVGAIQSMAATANVPVVLQCDATLERWYEQHGMKNVGIIESYALPR